MWTPLPLACRDVLGVSGLGDLAASLCRATSELIEGFNPDVALPRTQTLMEGAPFCDFRFPEPRESLAFGMILLRAVLLKSS